MTFAELVQYIVDPRNQPLDDFHFTPQTVLCQPCRVHYDFIGRYETLATDSQYVLRHLGVIDRVNVSRLNVSLRPHDNHTLSMDRVRAEFANIPTRNIDVLKNIYRADFEAFGYDSSIV